MSWKVFSLLIYRLLCKKSSLWKWLVCSISQSTNLIKKDNFKPFNSYRQPCHLHLLLAGTIWSSLNGEVKCLQCYSMLMGRYFLSPPWLPCLGTPWHQSVKYQEHCTGECPQKEHLAAGTEVMGKARRCRKEKLLKASCSEDQRGLCSCSGNARVGLLSLCERAAGSTDPCDGRLGAAKTSLQGLHLLILLSASHL